MYLKKKTEENGDIYLSIMEKYYDSSKKTARERTVESIGHVSELRKKYDDPVAHFTKYAKELTEKAKEETLEATKKSEKAKPKKTVEEVKKTVSKNVKKGGSGRGDVKVESIVPAEEKGE